MTTPDDTAVDLAFDDLVERLHADLTEEAIADLLVASPLTAAADRARLRDLVLVHVGILRSARGQVKRRRLLAAAAVVTLAAAAYLVSLAIQSPSKSSPSNPPSQVGPPSVRLPGPSVKVADWTREDLVNLMLSGVTITEDRFAAAFDRCRQERIPEAIPRAIVLAAARLTLTSGAERPSVAAARELLSSFPAAERLRAIDEFGSSQSNHKLLESFSNKLDGLRSLLNQLNP